MSFDPSTVRSTTVTLDLVHQRLFAAVVAGGVVDSSRVSLVMDDESLPVDTARDDAYVTIRFPSLVWPYGDVMGNAYGEFWVQGQTRVTLWLRNELDLYGDAGVAMEGAVAALPRGARMVGNLINVFFEKDLFAADGTTPILKRPFKIVSFEPAPPGRTDWRPFRLVVELEFSWSLALGG